MSFDRLSDFGALYMYVCRISTPEGVFFTRWVISSSESLESYPFRTFNLESPHHSCNVYTSKPSENPISPIL